MSRLPSRRRTLLLALALLVLAVAQHAYTLGNPLIWDSRLVVVEDPAIRDPANIPAFFLGPSLPPRQFEHARIAQIEIYRPLLKVLYTLEYALFGAAPAPYHLVNVVLNAAVVVTLFFLVLALGGARRLAFAAAALFAVNPASGVTVTWVYGVSGLVLALLVMLALSFYHQRRHGWALGLFTLALLSRETAVQFVAVLVTYEALLRPEEPARRFLNVLPYAGLAALYLALRTAVLGALPPLTEVPPLTWFNTSAVVLKRFLKLLAWPDAPVAFYPAELFPGVTAEVLIAYGVLAVGAVLLIVLWRADKVLAFWALWGLVWLGHTFNIGRWGDFLMMEKEMYLPASGFCVLLAALVLRLRAAPVLLALLLAAHFTVSVARSTYWRDPVVFFEQAVRFAPQFVNLRFGLASQYVAVEDYAAAARQFERIVEAFPRHSWALNNLGNSYYMQEDRARSVVMWHRALTADPGNANAAFNLGMAAEQAGDMAAALAYYRQYLAAAGSAQPEIGARIRRLERLVGPRGGDP